MENEALNDDKDEKEEDNDDVSIGVDETQNEIRHMLIEDDISQIVSFLFSINF